MRRPWSTAETLVVLAALGVVPGLLALRILFLHTLFVHNRSDALVNVMCRPFVDVAVRPGEQRHLSYALTGRTFSCAVVSNDKTTSR
jgi:hypothetical protein